MYIYYNMYVIIYIYNVNIAIIYTFISMLPLLDHDAVLPLHKMFGHRQRLLIMGTTSINVI